MQQCLSRNCRDCDEEDRSRPYPNRQTRESWLPGGFRLASATPICGDACAHDPCPAQVSQIDAAQTAANLRSSAAGRWSFIGNQLGGH